MSEHILSSEMPLPEHVENTINSLSKIDHAHHDNVTIPLRIIRYLTQLAANAGSLAYISLIIVVWISTNALLSVYNLHAPDPPPFVYLTLLLSTSSVYLTLLILASQKHEYELSTQRDQLTLNMATISEQKISMLIGLIEKLRDDNPDLKNHNDREIRQMASSADPEKMLDAIKHRDAK